MNKTLILFIAGIVLGVTAGAGFAYQWQSKKLTGYKLELSKAEAELKSSIIEQNRLSRERDNKVAEAIVLADKLANAKAKTIIKERIKYVQTNSNASCELDDEWVRIADSATPVSGTSKTATTTNDGSTGIPDLGRALQIMTDNYEVCQMAVDRYRQWQMWYRSTLVDE